MRRSTMLFVSVLLGALLLATFAGVALAKFVECKPNIKCEGTRRADFLLGTPSPDRIFGLGGADELLGLGDGDRLVGGKGRDRIEGGDNDQANDTLGGGPGEDAYHFNGAWGDDVIIDRANVDDDPFTGNFAIFFAAPGTPDNLLVNLNSDSGPVPEVNDGTNTVNWDGNVIGGVYVRTLGNDTLTGNSVANFFDNFEDGEGGNDTISAGDGSDNIQNQDQSGTDTLSGEGGNDFIHNSDKSGVDTVNGGEGNDEISSLGWDEGDGVNVFSGGNDIVNGGEGDDTIDVKDGFGGDVVDCGDGTDTVKYDPPDGTDPGDTLVPNTCEN